MSIRKLLGSLGLIVPVLMMVSDHVEAGEASIFLATLAEPNQKTAEISTDELRRILAENSAIVVDSRTPQEFEAGHIPGARVLDGVPPSHVSAIERLIAGDRSKPLVVYCNGPYCKASRKLADQLAAAGFNHVRRYQLGMPIWRALGGPTVVELGGIRRIFGIDRTAVFIDARSSDEFSMGSLAGARSAPVDDVLSGKLKKLPLPEDDFNRRVVLFGRNGAQARQLSDVLSKRPWHNVAYFPGTYAELAAALRAK
jgi:rhodanese-related sulfurtransferase